MVLLFGKEVNGARSWFGFAFLATIRFSKYHTVYLHFDHVKFLVKINRKK